MLMIQLFLFKSRDSTSLQSHMNYYAKTCSLAWGLTLNIIKENEVQHSVPTRGSEWHARPTTGVS